LCNKLVKAHGDPADATGRTGKQLPTRHLRETWPSCHRRQIAIEMQIYGLSVSI
jgi:hypothetical protein